MRGCLQSVYKIRNKWTILIKLGLIDSNTASETFIEICKSFRHWASGRVLCKIGFFTIMKCLETKLFRFSGWNEKSTIEKLLDLGHLVLVFRRTYGRRFFVRHILCCSGVMVQKREREQAVGCIKTRVCVLPRSGGSVKLKGIRSTWTLERCYHVRVRKLDSYNGGTWWSGVAVN